MGLFFSKTDSVADVQGTFDTSSTKLVSPNGGNAATPDQKRPPVMMLDDPRSPSYVESGFKRTPLQVAVIREQHRQQSRLARNEADSNQQ